MQDQGPVFLGLLTLVALLLVAQSLRVGRAIYTGALADRVGQGLFLVRQLGLLAAVLGILGQGLGLYSAFRVIEQAQLAMAPHLLWQGVATSFITTVYGLGQWALALVTAMLLRRWHQRRAYDAPPS